MGQVRTTKEDRTKSIWRVGMKQNQHNKKSPLSKEECAPVLFCECIMWARTRKVNEVNDQVSHTGQWRTRSGESERVLAMLYGGRCSERQHGPTNFIHRSEHEPERQRRMMQARVYGMVSATRERGWDVGEVLKLKKEIGETCRRHANTVSKDQRILMAECGKQITELVYDQRE